MLTNLILKLINHAEILKFLNRILAFEISIKSNVDILEIFNMN